MSNYQQKPSMDNEALSPFDQAEQIFSRLVKQLKDAEFKALLDKHNGELAAAEPTTELTDNLEAIEQAKVMDQLQRGCEYARNLFKAAIKEKGDNPDSELYKVSKRGLELLDQIEAGNNHLWRELDTICYTFVQLYRAECEKPAEIDSQQGKFGFHKKPPQEPSE